MAKTNPDKTILKTRKGVEPLIVERPAGTQATATNTYPGAYLPYSVSSPATYLHQNGATKSTGAPLNRRPVFAVERGEIGQDISSPTTPGDLVAGFHPQEGDVVYALAVTGTTYSPGNLMKPEAGSTYGALKQANATTGATPTLVGICRSTIATAATNLATQLTKKIKLEVL